MLSNGLKLRACSRSSSTLPSKCASIRRHFVSSSRIMLDQSQLSVSSNSDQNVILQEASELVEQGRWSLCNEGKGLERSFKFKGFKGAWDFMNEVAAECKKQKHHPEWTNIYNQTKVRWTTHNPEGLSNLDTAMARFCDQAGQKFGEVIPEDVEKAKSADWQEGARDCCARG